LGGQPCPTLHIGTRDQLPAVTLPMVGHNAGFKIKARTDLIPGCVALKFRVAGTFDNEEYVQVINDIAGTISGSVVEGIGLTGALYTLATFAGGSPTLLAGGTTNALQNASRLPAAITATINFEGNSNSLARCQISTIAVNLTDFSSGGFWQHVFPRVQDAGHGAQHLQRQRHHRHRGQSRQCQHQRAQ
jgi:hypothetical protein